LLIIRKKNPCIVIVVHLIYCVLLYFTSISKHFPEWYSTNTFLDIAMSCFFFFFSYIVSWHRYREKTRAADEIRTQNCRSEIQPIYSLNLVRFSIRTVSDLQHNFFRPRQNDEYFTLFYSEYRKNLKVNVICILT
jgi:hypothetical protein